MAPKYTESLQRTSSSGVRYIYVHECSPLCDNSHASLHLGPKNIRGLELSLVHWRIRLCWWAWLSGGQCLSNVSEGYGRQEKPTSNPHRHPTLSRSLMVECSGSRGGGHPTAAGQLRHNIYTTMFPVEKLDSPCQVMTLPNHHIKGVSILDLRTSPLELELFRLAVMYDDPDEDDDYEPKRYDDDEAKADRSRIGHFTCRGQEDPTHSSGKNASHRKPSLPIRKDTSSFSKLPPKGLNARGSLYSTGLPASGYCDPKKRDQGTNPQPNLPLLKKAHS
ncbi:hypothetical protein BU15DRAFT_60908 [Melanogaster broomeanus]|nr:hypothetical protein BU15DRAFT_60908 [Melanogaster broomeanus]